jgi:leader peptidase (prepilin peptidase)/N-methyltransferase
VTIQLLLKIFSFVFGSLIGSFLNVVIHRLPREMSVVTPRSSCPECKHMIKWYENIPILSYVFLRGKCSSCNMKISLRYPLIEFLTGMFAFFLAPKTLLVPDVINFIFYFSIASVFLAHLLIDIEHQLLPDKLNLYLLIVILPYVIINYPLYHWLIGGAIGFLGPLGVTYLFYKLRGQIGLGGGDIKLFGILGLILGPLGVMNNIFMSCMLGSIIGIVLIALKKLDKEKPFAFGPFIIIAASIQIFFPEVVEYINPLYIK